MTDWFTYKYLPWKGEKSDEQKLGRFLLLTELQWKRKKVRKKTQVAVLLEHLKAQIDSKAKSHRTTEMLPRTGHKDVPNSSSEVSTSHPSGWHCLEFNNVVSPLPARILGGVCKG